MPLPSYGCSGHFFLDFLTGRCIHLSLCSPKSAVPGRAGLCPLGPGLVEAANTIPGRIEGTEGPLPAAQISGISLAFLLRLRTALPPLPRV